MFRTMSRRTRGRVCACPGHSGLRCDRRVQQYVRRGLAHHKEIKTDCSVNTTIKGKTYCFGSEQAKEDFMKDPAANLAKAEFFYKSEHQG